MMEYNALIGIAKEASEAAGRAILEVYHSEDFGVESKSDNSPLTAADKAAHKVILELLEPTGLPVLSEEGKSIDYKDRVEWDHFWMIDPLDGTKEFIKRNGEFTVNIALVRNTEVIAGVVYAPVLDWLYWSVPGRGAYKREKDSTAVPILVSRRNLNDAGIKVVASRSHLNEETQAYIDSLKNAELVSMGSSLKILLVAEGSADVYPRFAPTMEWDTAAAHGVIKEAGGNVFQNGSDAELTYNKEKLLNPHFLVRC